MIWDAATAIDGFMKKQRLLVVSLLFMLTACGDDVKETLGLEHEAPDEFTVVSRPPLSVPKEFYLVPPTQGDAGEFGQDTSRTAREKLTGRTSDASDMSLEEAERGLAESAVPVVQSSDIETPGESALLRQAGADHVDPEIRKKLYSDQPVEKEEPGILETLRGSPNDEPVVDAAKEAERIRANKDAGKPLNRGQVETSDPKKDSVLKRIFD